MWKTRRTWRVVGAMMLLGLAAARPARGAAASQTDARAQFRLLLEQARDAYERGDPVAASVALKKAPKLIQMSLWQRISLPFLTDPWAWVALGFLGQGLFTARFVVQWLASEKRGKSVVPLSFWHLSIVGSLLVLSYAVWRLDPVFMLAYGFNSFVYVRNLMLIFRRRAEGAVQ